MPNPDLSILMSVHGTAQWLREALSSLESQLFVGFEVLVCANGQANILPTLEACRHFKSVQFLLINAKTVPLSDALNDLLGQARGRCIMRLDPDDKLPDDSRVLCDMVEHADCGYVIYGDYINFDDSEQYIHAIIASAENLASRSVGPYNYVAKADFFRAVAGWREVGYEDWDLLIRLVAGGARPCLLGRPALLHRVRSDGRLAEMKKNHQAHLEAMRQGNVEFFRRSGVAI